MKRTCTFACQTTSPVLHIFTPLSDVLLAIRRPATAVAMALIGRPLTDVHSAIRVTTLAKSFTVPIGFVTDIVAIIVGDVQTITELFVIDVTTIGAA